MTENAITLVGRLTNDPELKFTNRGSAVVRFTIAVERRWVNKHTGEAEKKVSFFTVQAWEKFAENVAFSLKKGYRVVVSGVIEQRTWETDAGEKRSVFEVNADAIGADLRFVTCELHSANRKESVPGDSVDDDDFF